MHYKGNAIEIVVENEVFVQRITWNSQHSSHTHLQAAQANAQSHACKRVACPTAQQTAKQTTEKNNEGITAPTRNWRFSG